MSETINLEHGFDLEITDEEFIITQVLDSRVNWVDQMNIPRSSFDALAMHSPLVKRIVDALSGLFPFAYARVDECSMDNADNDPDITKAKTVLAEIAALTEGHAEENK